MRLMRPGPVCHHQHAVGELHRLGQVVRDEQCRLLQRLLDPQHRVAEQQSRLLVERGERLVHQQDPRLGGERAGDRDALPHAARQLGRAGAARNPASPTSDTKCAARSIRSVFATPAISSGNATFSITVRHGNVDSSWNTIPIAGCVPETVSPATLTLAFVVAEQAADDVEQRRFSAAGRADDRDEFAGGDRKRHVVDGDDDRRRRSRSA